MKKRILAILSVGLLAASTTASADLIGADVNLTWYFPDTSTEYCDNGDATVVEDVEYPAGCSGFSLASVDIDGDQITVSHSNPSGWSPAEFNGFLLTILSGPAITSATYAGGTMSVADLLVDGGNLWVSFAGLLGEVGSGTAYIDLGFGDGPVNVPEPGTLVLMGLGLAGFGLSRRRRSS